jgi:hypothetical protein
MASAGQGRQEGIVGSRKSAVSIEKQKLKAIDHENKPAE